MLGFKVNQVYLMNDHVFCSHSLLIEERVELSEDNWLFETFKF